MSQYAAALTVEPGGIKWTRRMPYLSKKTDAMIFFTLKLKFWILWFWGNAYGAIAVIVTWIQECGENPMFHLKSQWSPETHLLPVSSA
jgi:hypothetical protein